MNCPTLKERCIRIPYVSAGQAKEIYWLHVLHISLLRGIIGNFNFFLVLYAVCTREEPIYFVTELIKHGTLLDYLTKGEGQHLKLPELIDIGAQVANCMAYLKSQHYIHRDFWLLGMY